MIGRSSLDVLPVDGELKKPYTDVSNVVTGKRYKYMHEKG